MAENLSHTIEDYLKTIYQLSTGGERASTNEIAEAMGVTPASVSGMIKKLATTDPPLLDYQRHHGVQLTAHGELAALETLRHHRLLEMFLHQMLGYEWDEVHAEAEQLEHVISEEFEERIAQALGDPSHDPHGDPIPTRELQMPETFSQRLCDLRPGQQAIVRRVNSENPELLRHLAGLGLIPQARLHILDYSPFDHNLSLRIYPCEESVTLGSPITRQVFVEVI